MRVVEPFEVNDDAIISSDALEPDYSKLEEGWNIIRDYTNPVLSLVNPPTNLHYYTNGNYIFIDGTDGKVYKLTIGGTSERQYTSSLLFEEVGVTWKAIAYNPNSNLIFLLQSSANRIWIFKNDQSFAYVDDFGVSGAIDITAYADGVLSLNSSSGSIIRFISAESGSVTFLDFSITTTSTTFTHITVVNELLYANTTTGVKTYNLFEDQTSSITNLGVFEAGVSISYDSYFNVLSLISSSQLVFNYLDYSVANSFWRIGDKCVYDGVSYVSMMDKNLDTPLFGSTKDTPTWKKIGNSNRYNMFNDEQQSQTERPDSLSVTLNFNSDFDTIALFNIDGTNVNIVHNGVINDNYDITGKTKLIISDFAGVSGSNLVITISNSGSIAKCGKLIVGEAFVIGESAYPTALRLQDYSRKETDDFGNITIIKRPNSKTIDYTVAIAESNADAIYDKLSSLTTTPCLYVDDDDRYPVFAYYEDMPLIISQPNINLVSLKVQELV